MAGAQACRPRYDRWTDERSATESGPFRLPGEPMIAVRASASMMALMLLFPMACAAPLQVQVIPAVIWSGIDSAVTEQSCSRITTVEEWRQVWGAHAGREVGKSSYESNPSVPKVDFDHFIVIAVFQGSGFQSHGLRFESAIREEKQERTLVVSYSAASYSMTGIGRRTEASPAVTPYAFFVLPRSTEAVLVQEITWLRGGDNLKKVTSRGSFPALDE